MTIAEICSRSVATVEQDAPIVEAARIMRQRHVGDVVVTKIVDGRVVPVGIVTDRDITVSLLAQDGKHLDELRVGDLLTREVVVVREDDSVTDVLHEMSAHGVRRVPVVGTRGELVGVVSADDVLCLLADQFGRLADVVVQGQERERNLRP